MMKRCYVLSLILVFFSSPLLAQEKPKEVRIGLLLALSGPFAEIGEDCRRGVDVARAAFASGDKVQGLPLKLIYGDSQADPKLGVVEFKKLVDLQHVDAIIVMRSSIGMVINPLSLQKRVPILGAVGHIDFAPQNRYAFQMWPSTTSEGSVLAEALIGGGRKSAAVITFEDEWTLSLSREFTKRFEALGGIINYTESVQPEQIDFASIVTKLKVKQPQAVFVNLGLAPGALTIKKIREQGISQPVYSNFWSGDPTAISAGGEAMEGVQFPEVNLNLPKFNAAFKDQFGDRRISGMTHSCYSSFAALAQAVIANPKLQSREELYQALLSLKSVALLDETVPMADREAQFPVVIKTIRAGKAVEPDSLSGQTKPNPKL